MVEKAGDIKANPNLQPLFYIKEIDSKCPKGYRSLVKKDKTNGNREHHNEASSKDKKKAKFYNPSSANQPQA